MKFKKYFTKIKIDKKHITILQLLIPIILLISLDIYMTHVRDSLDKKIMEKYPDWNTKPDYIKEIIIYENLPLELSTYYTHVRFIWLNIHAFELLIILQLLPFVRKT